jgi:5'-deoxynucleotidase YfbR-like HD superfamily hydrolase
LGEHVFLVARYTELMVNEFNLLRFYPMGDFLQAALSHDDDEAVYGDLPTGSSLAVNKEDPLINHPALVRATVKAADKKEAYLYTLEEAQLGNANMYQKWNKTELHWRIAFANLMVAMYTMEGDTDLQSTWEDKLAALEQIA